MIAAIIFAILAIICVAYGNLIRRVRSGVTFYRVWFALALVFGVLLILQITGILQTIISLLPFPFILAIAIVLCLAAFFLVVTQALIISMFKAAGRPHLDVVIVLGAQVRSTGPSRALKSRLDSAAAYLESNRNTKAIVSGGKGWNEPVSEAQCMADYLVERGISPLRITLEDQSTSTVENLRLSARFCDPTTQNIGIVTNNFHVFRSVGIAKKIGYHHAVGIAAYSDPRYLPNNMLRESLGIAKDLAVGNMTLIPFANSKEKCPGSKQ